MLRGSLLQYVLNKARERFREQYRSELSVGLAEMQGLSGVKLQQICLVPEGADTLLQLDTLDINIKLWPLLRGDLQLDNLGLGHGSLRLIRYDSTDNFSVFLRGRKSNQVQDSSKQVNLAKTAYRTIRKILVHVPDEVLLRNFMLYVNDRSVELHFNIRQLQLKGQQFDASFQVASTQGIQNWLGKGNAYPDDMKGEISLYSADTGKIRLPFIDEKYHLSTGFDSLHLNLAEVNFEGEHLKVRGQAAISNFVINHKRIAKTDVVVRNAAADFSFLLGENFVSVDSSSVFRVNRFVLHPYLYFQRRPEIMYAVKLNSETIDANDFFASLPEGMFSSVEGLKATGKLSYHLNLQLLHNDPWNVQFDSELKKENFHISSFGAVDLSKINNAFTYTPYEYGRPMRSFEIGPGNPSFTPLEQISPYLRYAVLCSEDPSFFYHRGFVMEAIRQSLATNYVNRRFKRGASTISMQLVKNIFLTRDKVLSRKFEEILITWLIENNHLSNKERMFEVYLNLIEWGPNVYGIGEAARFYFDKHPSQLNLQESIFLCSIIPRPKAFRYYFGPDGNLRPFMKNTFRFISGRMLMREQILPIDTIGLQPYVQLNGPAKNFIIVTDTLSHDTLNLPLEQQDFFDE